MVYKPTAEAIVKAGKGKDALPVFAVSGYQNKADSTSYKIVHIPTNTLVADCFYFKATARNISQNLIDHYPASFWMEQNTLILGSKIADSVKQYVQYYRFNDSKEVLTIEGWTNAGNYNGALAIADSGAIPKQQAEEYAAELWAGHSTLAWVPSKAGGLEWDELAALIDGRHLPSEKLS